MSAKWEYKLETRMLGAQQPIGIAKPCGLKDAIQARFNELGNDGWEYVGVVERDGTVEGSWIFKRAKASP